MSQLMIIQYSVIGAAVLLLLVKKCLDIWQDLRPGYIRALLVQPDKDIKPYRRKVELDSVGSECFTVGKCKYAVDNARVYRVGLLRIPTSYYIEGDAEPKDFFGMDVRSEVVASDYRDATESNVISQVLAAFQEQVLSPETWSMITLIVMGVGFFGVYYFINQKLELVLKAIGSQ